MNPFIKSEKQLSIFTTAGFPNLNSLSGQLEMLEEEKVDFIEVGIPFSDPMADGPIIQETSAVALKNGMNMTILFGQLAKRTTKTPIVLMGYLNPVIRYGIEPFLQNCHKNQIHSVILPDMSLEIYERFYQTDFEKYGVTPCFLVTPQTESSRIEQIAEACQNSFVYLVSSNATTGNKQFFSDELIYSFQRVKSLCGKTPLFVGFGIKSAEDVERVHKVADGAIIGSAYLLSEDQREFVKNLRNSN